MQAIVQDRYGSTEVARGCGRSRSRRSATTRSSFASTPPCVNVGRLGRHDTACPTSLRPVYGPAQAEEPGSGDDVAGTVEAVGPGCHAVQARRRGLRLGRRRRTPSTRPRPQDKLATKPANLDFEQAAAVAMAGLDRPPGCSATTATSQPGQKVLINGASGGVGTFAVQIAKSLGAEVTGVTQHARTSTWSGRSGPTTSSTTRARTSPRGGQRYDFILDNVGEPLARRHCGAP